MASWNAWEVQGVTAKASSVKVLFGQGQWRLRRHSSEAAMPQQQRLHCGNRERRSSSSCLICTRIACVSRGLKDAYLGRQLGQAVTGFFRL